MSTAREIILETSLSHTLLVQADGWVEARYQPCRRGGGEARRGNSASGFLARDEAQGSEVQHQLGIGEALDSSGGAGSEAGGEWASFRMKTLHPKMKDIGSQQHFLLFSGA
jgi:hypothetical protein